MEVLAQNRDYYATLAITGEEIDTIFKIRYQVFFEELGEGEFQEDGRERDSFDKYCEFIIIKSKETEEIVGLYRILPYYKMDPKIGYYTNIEFDLKVLMTNDRYKNSVAELGRLAIIKEHRGGTNLLLLWGGLVTFCRKNKIRYLFGCGSMPVNTEKKDIEALYYQLEAKKMIHNDPLITPRKPSEIRTISQQLLNKRPNNALKDVPDDVIELSRPNNLEEIPDVPLPKLIRRYRAVGTKIIGKPAFDSYDFGIYDFLVMIDLNKLKARFSYAMVIIRLFLNRLGL